MFLSLFHSLAFIKKVFLKVELFTATEIGTNERKFVSGWIPDQKSFLYITLSGILPRSWLYCLLGWIADEEIDLKDLST